MPSRGERGIVGVTDRVGDEADRHGRAAEGNHPHAELVDVDVERRTAVFRRRAVAAVLRVAVHRVTPSLHVPCNSSSYRHRRGSGRGARSRLRRAGFEGAGLGERVRRGRRAHPDDGEQSRQRRAAGRRRCGAQTRECRVDGPWRAAPAPAPRWFRASTGTGRARACGARRRPARARTRRAIARDPGVCGRRRVVRDRVAHGADRARSRVDPRSR